MNNASTIPKQLSNQYGKDFNWLRQAGIGYIETMSGKLWTDYNTHDPGITFLELLCYAITDLGYRIAAPIEDLVASPVDNERYMHEQFLSALHVLPNAPVTADDYRKILIRIDGVKNAWLLKNQPAIIARFKEQPPQLRYATSDSEQEVANEELKFHLNGLCDILVEFDELHAVTEEERQSEKELILEQVRKVYHHFRNLGEDVMQIREVPEQEIVLCSDIELEPKADPEQVWAAIAFAVDQYLSPDINFYTLAEMQAKGKSSNELFDGPAFDYDRVLVDDEDGSEQAIFTKKGFIDDAELRNSALRSQVRLSDLIRVIQQVAGVKSIRSIAFAFCSCEEEDPQKVAQLFDADNWLLCLKPGHKAVLCLDNTVLNFYKDVIPIQLKETEARSKLSLFHSQHKRRLEAPAMEDLPMPTGAFGLSGHYATIQNHLPETYGVGRYGLSADSSEARKAQAKQLKAYLLFFDQVLANYFAQLSQVKNLLSAEHEVAATYFTTAVQQLKDVEDILPQGAQAAGRALDRAKLDNYPERKNMFLDHLLARFNEQFGDYVFLLHRLYGADFDHAAIRHKVDFLKDYEQASAWRGSAFDYYNTLSQERSLVNVSGMEKRISRLLGFQSYARRPLAALPYQVKKANASPHAFFTWNIFKEASLLLTGSGTAINEVDAYEDLGLATILACASGHYRWVVHPGGTACSFAVVDAQQHIIARSLSSQAIVLQTEEVFGAALPTLQKIAAATAAQIVFQLASDQKKVTFSLFDERGRQLARAAAYYPLLPGELESGHYTLAQPAVDLVMAATVSDFYYALDEVSQDFSCFLKNADDQMILYTDSSFSTTNFGGGEFADLYLEREEMMAYFLHEFKLEGIYVVEHILLRPDSLAAATDEFMPVCIDPNGTHCRPLDPYSFRIDVILPGYSLRLRNKYFRKYAERLIREETPAHILPRICFVDEDNMALFETTYQIWMQARQEAASLNLPMDKKVNKDLIEVIENLFTIYEQGYLADCDDDTENINPIVLGSTFLGTVAPNTDDPDPE